MDWVSDFVPPPVSKKEQRELRHRRYVLQGAIEDIEFRLQQLAYQLMQTAAGDGRQADLQAQISSAQAELQALNDELDALPV